ncbi:MipA/OmpV family protein [Alteromonas sp. ASW11-130]|uniref:MipA/OmpV family protein n=1 Tax=Alteromonas sp. ASW11-130 TaxID=3015775 RepID=UPI002242B78F|nr:MipA/OmpV family protein [Alteromonas sp. ASW11-130]MCW8093323.1 MipA/OmpV family protein [Alteromonas sp. ASW11-130]
MKKVAGSLLVMVVCGSFFHPVIVAQEQKTAMVPLPSVDDFTNGNNGWSAGLGLGIEYESAYEGSDEFGFEVDPAGAVQWRSGDNIFYWAGEALGWRGLRYDMWLLEAAVVFEEGREESDSDDGHLDGLGDGDEGLEVLLQARHAFDSDWRYWLDSRLLIGDNGTLGLLGAGYRFGDQNDGTGSSIAVAVVFHDSDYANKDFGINAEQSAASGLNETYLSGGFRSIGFHYNYRTYINQNWQLFGEIVYERYGSDIEDSPIARNNYEAEAGLGVIYVF